MNPRRSADADAGADVDVDAVAVAAGLSPAATELAAAHTAAHSDDKSKSWNAAEKIQEKNV